MVSKKRLNSIAKQGQMQKIKQTLMPKQTWQRFESRFSTANADTNLHRCIYTVLFASRTDFPLFLASFRHVIFIIFQ